MVEDVENERIRVSSWTPGLNEPCGRLDQQLLQTLPLEDPPQH